MTERTRRLSRRSFLVTLAAGGAATAAAVATKSAAPIATTSSKDKRVTRGYQSSEHVNTYYRTTKV